MNSKEMKAVKMVMAVIMQVTFIYISRKGVGYRSMSSI